MLEKLRALGLAFCVLLFVYVVVGWNSPITSPAGQVTTQKDGAPNSAKDEKNVTPTLGFVVSTLLADAFDFVQARHDVFIIAGTFLLAFFTGTLWWSTKKLVKNAPQIERAYISGSVASQNGRQSVLLIVNNSGKTPGEILGVELGFCRADNIPPIPQYQMVQLTHHIRPGESGLKLEIIPVAQFQMTNPMPPGNIPIHIYGRLHYRDIFGDTHDFGFFVSVGPGDTTRVTPDAPRPYVTWN